MDFERFELSLLKNSTDVEDISQKLLIDLPKTYDFVQENYNLVTLSIETSYKGVYEAAQKRIEYLDFLKTELLGIFSNFISTCSDEESIEKVVGTMAKYEYIFQIHDSVKDLTSIKDSMEQNYIEFKSDVLLIVRELSSKTLSLFEYMFGTDTSFMPKKDLK